MPMTAQTSQAFSSLQNNNYQILGIGTPIVDYFIHVSDNYVASLSGLRGGSSPIDPQTFQKILNDHPSPYKLIAGGSAANTIKGLSRLGHACALIGKIGQDEAAQQFIESIKSYGVTPNLSTSQLSTARVFCLLTPDGERTMRSLMGAGAEMSESDLTAEHFKVVNLVHIEGYLMNRQGVVEKAMRLAKEAGAKISFDLSSFEIVQNFKKQISDLLVNFVDIVFANEEEAQMLTGLPPEKACTLIKDLSHIAIVKTGSQGCWAATKNQKAFHNAFKVNIVDTTGAGDLFASGFLHGFLTNKTLEESLCYGSFIASEVIQTVGAEIPEQNWPEIKKNLVQFPKHLQQEIIFLSQEG